MQPVEFCITTGPNQRHAYTKREPGFEVDTAFLLGEVCDNQTTLAYVRDDFVVNLVVSLFGIDSYGVVSHLAQLRFEAVLPYFIVLAASGVAFFYNGY